MLILGVYPIMNRVYPILKRVYPQVRGGVPVDLLLIFTAHPLTISQPIQRW